MGITIPMSSFEVKLKICIDFDFVFLGFMRIYTEYTFKVTVFKTTANTTHTLNKRNDYFVTFFPNEPFLRFQYIYITADQINKTNTCISRLLKHTAISLEKMSQHHFNQLMFVCRNLNVGKNTIYE